MEDNNNWKIGLTEYEIFCFSEKVRQANLYNISKSNSDAPLIKLQADKRGVGIQVIVDEIILKRQQLNMLEYRFLDSENLSVDLSVLDYVY